MDGKYQAAGMASQPFGNSDRPLGDRPMGHDMGLASKIRNLTNALCDRAASCDELLAQLGGVLYQPQDVLNKTSVPLPPGTLHEVYDALVQLDSRMDRIRERIDSLN